MVLLGHLAYTLEERFVGNLWFTVTYHDMYNMYCSLSHNAGSFCNIISSDYWSQCDLQYVGHNSVVFLLYNCFRVHDLFTFVI